MLVLQTKDPNFLSFCSYKYSYIDLRQEKDVGFEGEEL
jgi:hypothetical protein